MIKRLATWQTLALGITLLGCSPPDPEPGSDLVEGDLTSGGVYVVKSVNSGKCVDVTGNLATSGALIEQWDCNGQKNQQFKFTATSNGYEVRPMNGTTQCLDVFQASLVNGGVIDQWSCNGHTSQRWKVLTTSTSGQFELQAVNSGKCLDVINSSTARGAKLQQNTCGAKANQRFTFSTVSGGGTGGTGGSSGGGTGGSSGTGGSTGGLTWRKANLTFFTSYPDPGSAECIQFNGCMWAGQFAFVNGTQSKSWVAAHNIAAVHEKDAAKYALKTLRLKQGTHQIDVTVYDECADSDCSGCCTENASQNGYNFLIDIEENTAARFGTNDGTVDWACLNCN
jgi:hypothetical protein